MSQAQYHWEQLQNGPRLAVATLAASECAALSIYIPAGSRNEVNLPTGLAHFLEHMIFKGTPNRSAREISFQIENAGGQLNACTSEDQTVYEGHGEADMLPVLAEVLCDMVWNSSFPENEITLEREVIGEEITMYKESPADHIGDLISAALWETHPLGNSISGSLESIEQIHRQTLRHFRDQHHFRQDVVVAVAGPFTFDAVAKTIQPHLPSTPFLPAQALLPFARLSSPPRRIHDTRESDQLQLALAWHTPGRHSPMCHALRMLSMMLGESSSSRLFLELREERGLCYQIGSDVTFFHETGAFEISAGLDPESRDQALACIHHEIHDLLTHGPRPGELDRAKRLTIAQSKIAFETTSAHANWAGQAVMDYGRIPTPAEWRCQIYAVTDTDVQSIAREVFENQAPAIAEIGGLNL